MYRQKKTKIIETFVDASFAGEWNTAWNEPSSVMSRTSYAIMYAN